jgi:hypothetical protein
MTKEKKRKQSRCDEKLLFFAWWVAKKLQLGLDSLLKIGLL